MNPDNDKTAKPSRAEFHQANQARPQAQPRAPPRAPGRGRRPGWGGEEAGPGVTLAKLGSRRALRPQTRRLRTDGAPRAATLKRRLSRVRRRTLRVRCLAAMR